MDIEEIKEFREYMVNERHARRVLQQRQYLEYIKNAYKIPLVEDEKYVTRTFSVSEMMNGVTQSAIDGMARVYADGKNKEAASRVAKIANAWCQFYRDLPRNLFKKIAFSSGSAWLYVPHNDTVTNWMDDEDWRDVFPDMMPVHFITYDPMIVFADPSEEIDGVPKRVLVDCEWTVADVMARYPRWTNPMNLKPSGKVHYMYYVDKDVVYAEANGEALFRNKVKPYGFSNGTGIRKNPWGFVPFVHAYSGYGTETEARDPELLEYSRISMVKEKITEHAQASTDLRRNMHEFAWKYLALYVPDGVILPEDFLKDYRKEPNTLSIIRGTGGSKIEVEETQTFGADYFAYRDRLTSELNSAYPSALRGQYAGESSGRQLDITGSAAMDMYDAPIENTAKLLSDGIKMALKVCDKLDILPKGVQGGDIDKVTELSVEIRREDPTVRDTRIIAGRAEVAAGTRSLRRFLIEDRKMTEEEAEDEIDTIMAEELYKDPMFRSFLGMKVAEKAGMSEEFQLFKQFMAMQGQQPQAVGDMTGTQGGQPRTFNIQSPQGYEMAGTTRAPRGTAIR